MRVEGIDLLSLGTMHIHAWDKRERETPRISKRRVSSFLINSCVVAFLCYCCCSFFFYFFSLISLSLSEWVRERVRCCKTSRERKASETRGGGERCISGGISMGQSLRNWLGTHKKWIQTLQLDAPLSSRVWEGTMILFEKQMSDKEK